MRTKTIVIDAGDTLYSNDPALQQEGNKQTFLQSCRDKGIEVLVRLTDDAEECGCCGYYHFPDIWGPTGDCRDDDARFIFV